MKNKEDNMNFLETDLINCEYCLDGLMTILKYFLHLISTFQYNLFIILKIMEYGMIF